MDPAPAPVVQAQNRAKPVDRDPITLAISAARLGSMASKAPALISASTTRLLTRPLSMRAQKSKKLLNGPLAVRSATMASMREARTNAERLRLRPERVLEVRYDQLEGRRFRHTVQFDRWRPDRDPRSCTYDQLEQVAAYDLADVLT